MYTIWLDGKIYLEVKRKQKQWHPKSVGRQYMIKCEMIACQSWGREIAVGCSHQGCLLDGRTNDIAP